MPEPIRVLRVIARLNAGGPAHHVGILSSRMDALGYETLLVHGSVGPDETELPGFAERYPCRRLAVPALGPKLAPWRDLRALLRLIAVARAVRPDIVHTHTAKAGLLGRLAAATLRPRPVIVHTYHGHVLEGYFGAASTWLYRTLERALARLSDRLVGVSEQTVDELVRLGVARRERFACIPLGLDLGAFVAAGPAEGAALREQLIPSGDDLLVASIGRLVPVKRLDVALRAVAYARGLGAPVRLAVVGEGPLRPALARETERLGIAGAVTFLGTRGDIVAIVAAADLMLLSSDSEGTPVSLIEGAAAGTPAVATEVGGVREVVAEGAGKLVPAGDWRALGEALAELARAPADRREMGESARQHVVGRYDAGRLVDDVHRLYDATISARPMRHRAG